MPIIAVALHRLATGFADGVFERGHGLLLRRRCSGHVKDLFLHNRAMQIVHAVAERDLRERQSKADPVGSKMIDVIQINAAHREIAKLLECGCAFDVRQGPWIGTVRKRTERSR